MISLKENVSVIKKINDTIELLPEDRPWQYDCDGVKTYKGDFTKLWTEEDERIWVEEYNRIYHHKKTH